jgi:hypothetical protein
MPIFSKPLQMLWGVKPSWRPMKPVAPNLIF